MIKRETIFDPEQLLPMALSLWIGYFFMLAVVDWFFGLRDPRMLLYYGIQFFNGLIIFFVTLLLSRSSRQRAERSALLLALILIALLPILTVHIMIRLAPSELLLSPNGMTLRLIPTLLLGLLLTAWQYQWRHVIIFSIGTGCFNLMGLFLPIRPRPFGAMIDAPPPSHSDGILAMVIQTIILLIVGYFTSRLINRLRRQHQTLEAANLQLRHQASTREALAISQERNRMARELHDTLAHSLGALTVQLQTVQAYWDVEPATAQKMLNGAISSTRSGLQETRRALKALRATPLEELALAVAIRQLATSVAERSNLELALSITESLPPLGLEMTQSLYRIVQEAIMNVAYHADAKKLAVVIRENSDGIQLTVEDDGIGFDEEGQYPGHWGLQGMRERANLVGGSLLIQSRPNQGTAVQLTIPQSAIEETAK